MELTSLVITRIVSNEILRPKYPLLYFEMFAMDHDYGCVLCARFQCTLYRVARRIVTLFVKKKTIFRDGTLIL